MPGVGFSCPVVVCEVDYTGYSAKPVAKGCHQSFCSNNGVYIRLYCYVTIEYMQMDDVTSLNR